MLLHFILFCYFHALEKGGVLHFEHTWMNPFTQGCFNCAKLALEKKGKNVKSLQ